MALAWLAFFDSLIAIAVALAGLFAAHRGYATPFFGFTLFALGLFFAALALVMAIIALLIMLFSPRRRSALPRAIMGGVFGLIVVVPVLVVVMTHPYPAINDITTDTKSPPEFVHAQELPANHGRAMKYDAAAYAQVQQNAAVYHDLLPLKLDASPDDAYKKAEIIVGDVAFWRITARDPRKRTLLSADPNSADLSLGPVVDEPVGLDQPDAEHVTMRFGARREGWLVVSDAYTPDWAATVDGEARPVVRAR